MGRGAGLPSDGLVICCQIIVFPIALDIIGFHLNYQLLCFYFLCGLQELFLTLSHIAPSWLKTPASRERDRGNKAWETPRSLQSKVELFCHCSQAAPGMPLLLCLACASPPAPETWLQPSHDAGNFFICTCPSTAQHGVISKQMGPAHAVFASILVSHPAALDTFLFSEGLICPMHKYCPVSPYPRRSPTTSIHSKWGR